MLGAIPLPPPKREVDLAAVEQVIRDLNAAGLDSLAVADRAGPERFVELGRSVLAMQRTQLAMGADLSTEALIGEVQRFVATDEVDLAFKAFKNLETPVAVAVPRPHPRKVRAPKPRVDRSGQRAEQAKARAVSRPRLACRSSAAIGTAHGRCIRGAAPTKRPPTKDRDDD